MTSDASTAWAEVAKTLIVMSAMTIILWRVASEFDATEIKALGGLLATLGGTGAVSWWFGHRQRQDAQREIERLRGLLDDR